MNERIKELWENSDIGVFYPVQGSPVSVSPQILEKFAELIVKDCLNQIKDMLVDESEQLYPNNKKTTECVNERLLDAHDNISELFGVE